ncbi:MAG: hypothetical protein VB050_03940 [Geobacteraceae bacterium]|nr:hypothetical protein [Geobacteraceae bacterium]
MNITEGLRILVVDWQGLHEDGGTKLSVEQVVGTLFDGGGKAVTPGLKPGQIAELILEEIRRMPGALANSEKFMAQFDSAEDLLEEIDLECLVADLTMG